MNKENFKQLAIDMKPLINDMTKLLKAHGVEKLVSVTVSADGYFSFNAHECDWYMYRINENVSAKVSATAKAGFGEEV